LRLEQVTITVSEETDRALARLARREHGGDRGAAAEDLLAEWLERRE
jgi:predicted transcriptional regulator